MLFANYKVDVIRYYLASRTFWIMMRENSNINNNNNIGKVEIFSHSSESRFKYFV